MAQLVEGLTGDHRVAGKSLTVDGVTVVSLSKIPYQLLSTGSVPT